MMEISGKITFVDLSGGFWGIVGDNGQNYQPTKPLPKSLQEEGKKVKAQVEQASGMSIFMWGTQVDVNRIDAV